MVMKRPWLPVLVLAGVLAGAGAAASWMPGWPRSPSPGAISTVDAALARKDLDLKAPAWRETYPMAPASPSWEALVEAGDAARRIGEVASSPQASDTKAREIYRSALVRARQEESLDGVLRIAEAFAALGDREALDQSIRIAETLAARDPEAQADVRALAARVADLLSSRGDPRVQADPQARVVCR